MEIKLLEKIGLTEGESKVYLALLELGQSSITNIITKSGVSTSKVYDILNRIENKGLVSHVIMKGVKYFKAADPQRIIEILEEEKEKIENTKLQINKIIPELIAKQKLKEAEEEAEIFVGMKGLASVFNEETEWMKKTKKPSYVIGLTKGGKAGKQVDKFFERIQAQRDKLKLDTYVIFNKNLKGQFPYLDKSKYCYPRYIEHGTEMVSINIFNDKTVIAVYSKKPFLFVIKSKDVANDFRDYFKALWKKAEK